MPANTITQAGLARLASTLRDNNMPDLHTFPRYPENPAWTSVTPPSNTWAVEFVNNQPRFVSTAFGQPTQELAKQESIAEFREAIKSNLRTINVYMGLVADNRANLAKLEQLEPSSEQASEPAASQPDNMQRFYASEQAREGQRDNHWWEILPTRRVVMPDDELDAYIDSSDDITF